MASSIAQYVVSLASNGRVASQGSISEIFAEGDKLATEIVQDQEALQRGEDLASSAQVTEKRGDGKLVMEEEILVGRVSWAASRCHVIVWCFT